MHFEIRDCSENILGGRWIVWLPPPRIGRICVLPSRRIGNCRGITMACSIYNLYCGVLNRLTIWAEEIKKLWDSQNGFRKDRSCADHLSTLAEIVNTRKHRGLSTYVLFVDFSNAFDRVDHNMLWWKLEKLGVNQKFMCAIKSMYCNVQCSFRLNRVLSDWFTVRMGLKQVCVFRDKGLAFQYLYK